MSASALRWTAVCVLVASGWYASLHLMATLSGLCLNLVSGDALSECPVWLGRHWLAIAGALTGLILYVGSVVLPILVAPSHKVFTAVVLTVVIVAGTARFFKYAMEMGVPVLLGLVVGTLATASVAYFLRQRGNVA